ncbi:MAG: hypothetical protein QOJ52_4458 [Acidimicrobiaceae bacterium]|nr:hypothetical protein [Acidimicrobiaceae bacterium]
MDVAGARQLRVSDADRDRIAGALGTHYAAGRLDTAGLSDRLDRVYAAELREQAAAVLADLPPLEAGQSSRASRRRHAEAATPGAGWIPSTERFRDPTTRRIMRVWVDPTDATRHYVEEA